MASNLPRHRIDWVTVRVGVGLAIALGVFWGFAIYGAYCFVAGCPL